MKVLESTDQALLSQQILSKIKWRITLLRGVLALNAASWDDINFRFHFCNEVVYPPDHDFMSF